MSKIFIEKEIAGSFFNFTIIKINENDVAIIIDNNKEGTVTVTNNIERIGQELNVSKIIYKDSEGIYDYWDKSIGFRSLSYQNKKSLHLFDAIKVATIAYIKRN